MKTLAVLILTDVTLALIKGETHPQAEHKHILNVCLHMA